MEKIIVNQWKISSIWYDSNKKILEIEFLFWNVNRYLDISQLEYIGLMFSWSYIKYINDNFKEKNESNKKRIGILKRNWADIAL